MNNKISATTNGKNGIKAKLGLGLSIALLSSFGYVSYILLDFYNNFVFLNK